MIDGLSLPPKPAIIRPREPELIRPGDPRWVTPGLTCPLGVKGIGGKKIRSRVIATLVDQVADPVDRSTYTFTGRALGAAFAGKRVLIWANFAAGTAITLTSITVAGSGTTNALADGVVNTHVRDEVRVTTAVESATSGDVVVSLSGTAVYCIIGIYALAGLPATGAPATFHTAAQTNATFAEGARSISLNIAEGGAGISAAFRTAETDAAYGGLDFDVRVNRTESSQSLSFAHRNFTGKISSHSITVTSAVTLKAVSFAPYAL